MEFRGNSTFFVAATIVTSEASSENCSNLLVFFHNQSFVHTLWLYPNPKLHSNLNLHSKTSAVTCIDSSELTVYKLFTLTAIFLSLDKTGNKCLLIVNFIKYPRMGQDLLNCRSPRKLIGIITKNYFRDIIFHHTNKL